MSTASTRRCSRCCSRLMVLPRSPRRLISSLRTVCGIFSSWLARTGFEELTHNKHRDVAKLFFYMFEYLVVVTDVLDDMQQLMDEIAVSVLYHYMFEENTYCTSVHSTRSAWS
eukprot:GFUD01028205.1.p1 GENE.GFUD01028205.1~~GFUD01028205.1.p1  ORF type:complete len:113 (+),score=7.51 GFUD01028205.1:222-560(+)